MKNSICAIALMGLSGTALAGAIDGTAFDVKYGAAAWSQNVGTQFGNNGNPDALAADGSEINALYGTISGGVLRLGIAGNLQTNFNKINIALDFKSGGQNQLSGLGGLGNLNGLTFDNGFESDAVLSFTHGFDGPTYRQFIDGAIAGDTADNFLGGGDSTGTFSVMLGGAMVNFGLNNSNTGGVANLGEAFTSDPALVTTGLEIEIDLAALGYTGGAINIAGWVNGSGNDFMSNQVIGGLPDGTGNLGGDGNGNFTGNLAGIDFNNFAGNQFVTIVPAPGTVALLGLGGFVAARRRR